jgi:hypothetical protein
MFSRFAILFAASAALVMAPCPALPCSLCGVNLKKQPTLRQEAADAKAVIYGNLANPRLNANDPAGGGTTELHLEAVIKSNPVVKGRKQVELPRYLPVDPKKPSRLLVFCDTPNGKLDPYRGVSVQSPAMVEYLRGAMARAGADTRPDLEYHFRFLDHPEKEIAADAFLEFAKADDDHIGRVAPKLDAAKVRGWLRDEKTPPERIGLFAFLLGGCGGEADAALLRGLLTQRATERTTSALGGILAGYIHLRAREGWDLAVSLLRDENRPLLERLSLLGTLKFYQTWKPKETRTQILRAVEVLLPQGDVADLAVEDLRRWQWWELTPAVLSQFGKKSHDAPITRRAIVRYAMSCPQREAQEFVDKLRKSDRQLYDEVRESLQLEK